MEIVTEDIGLIKLNEGFVTLLYEMRRRKSKKGLASLCIGGGMGSSALIELPEEGDDEK
jgi:acetyl-CoA acetyltransferase